MLKIKYHDASSMVEKRDFNTKATEIEGKIPNVRSLVKKTDYAVEITNKKNAYVTNAALNARHKDLLQEKNLILKYKK